MKTLTQLFLAAVVTFTLAFQGCVTTVGDSNIDLHKLGRISTIAYLTQKDRMNPDHKKAIEITYKMLQRGPFHH